MKKRIWSLVLVLCMLIMLVPSSVSADETDYKEIYFDFLKDELITKKNSNDWSKATLADLNLDGIPELIMPYYYLIQSGIPLAIFQIIDNEVQLRYMEFRDKSNQFNKDYFEHICPDSEENLSNLEIAYARLCAQGYLALPSFDDSITLRRNKNTGELLYTNSASGGEEHLYGCLFTSFSTDEIFKIHDKFCELIQENSDGYIISSDYRIDGNNVSKQEYDIAYNEFLDIWQDTGYKLKYLDCREEVTEQKIREFLNYYVPEKQFLGITDEDDTDKYGYVDVMPISRQEFDDRYEIKVSYKNNSSETITNKRIVLACTTMTNSKTKNQSEVVAAYKDSEDVFNPYEEKIVTTRIHCKKTADGIPYVIGDKPFSSNYRRYHSFLDDMTLITVQFANDKEYNDFMAEIEANHLTDLSTDEYIESNSMWLKTFKGDK